MTTDTTIAAARTQLAALAADNWDQLVIDAAHQIDATIDQHPTLAVTRVAAADGSTSGYARRVPRRGEIIVEVHPFPLEVIARRGYTDFQGVRRVAGVGEHVFPAGAVTVDALVDTIDDHDVLKAVDVSTWDKLDLLAGALAAEVEWGIRRCVTRLHDEADRRLRFAAQMAVENLKANRATIAPEGSEMSGSVRLVWHKFPNGELFVEALDPDDDRPINLDDD